MSEETPRQRFLLHMYDQMFNDINRHIIVVWQSVGVLIGAFAILALVEKKVISLDVGASILILICSWVLATLIDSGYWYNRNLAIVSNIEREFLEQGDLRAIIYYFGAHRPNNKMITHLRIQWALGFSIGVLVLLFHFFDRVLPGVKQPWSSFQPLRALPYVTAVLALLYLRVLRGQADRKYGEFLENSPGKDIDGSKVKWGEGHGFPRRPKIEEQLAVGAPPPRSSTGPST